MSYTSRPTGNYPTTNANTTNISNTTSGASSLLRQQPSASTAGSLSTSNSQSQSHLQSRIASKRAELENLQQLRDLSADLATQLAALEAKLATLRDGTQSVALVLANWDNVLRAISMAAGMFASTYNALSAFFLCLCRMSASELAKWRVKDVAIDYLLIIWWLVKIPRPIGDEQDEEERTKNHGELGSGEKNTMSEKELPVPLVRIPVQQKTEDGG